MRRHGLRKEFELLSVLPTFSRVEERVLVPAKMFEKCCFPDVAFALDNGHFAPRTVLKLVSNIGIR